MKQNLAIILAILIVTGWPLSLWWVDSNAFKRGETDCQTKSQKVVIENQARYQVELKKAATKAKNRGRIITRYERELRHSDNDVCADSRISDIRAKRVHDTICDILPEGSELQYCTTAK